MAAKLARRVVLLAIVLLSGCSAPWSSSTTTSTATATTGASGSAATNSVPTASSAPAETPKTRPSPTVTVLPTPTQGPTPTPTPVPTPVVQSGPVASCCGVFAWADASKLLVFDTPSGKQQGAWLDDVKTGSRELLSSVFGVPNQSGLIAFPNKTRGTTQILKLDGTLVSTIHNGGVLTWISPDGKHVAWLVDQGVTNTSSEVDRVVQLTVANIDGSNQKSLVTFEAAALHWLPDNLHVVALARAPGGSHSGIWSVNTSDGTNAVVVPATYVNALQVSPDGTRMAYLVTFSGDKSKDGVWVSDVDGSHAVHLKEVGAYRWAGDSSSLWFLNLAPPGSGEDHLVKVDVASDSVVATVGIGGRVLGGQWEVNPTGNIVAYWSEQDQSVRVRALTP